jgi:hypothetical protein
MSRAPRRATPARYAIFAIAGLALAGCANLQRHASLETSHVDDDAYCQKTAGPQGSNAYVACRKDRDVQRGLADDKIERQHRNLAERMLNGQ